MDTTHLDARQYTRQQFYKNAQVSDPKELEKLIKVGQQAIMIITRNIVQGIKKPGTEDTFVLQITPDKEINSNDTIKMKGCGQPAQRI